MRQIKTSLLKRFKPGISSEMIEITNKQIDGVNLALEALDRITPAELTADVSCLYCGRNLKKIYEAAEAPVYCCPYCGQALGMEAE